MLDRFIPDHVPDSMVVDFNYIEATNRVSDPYAELLRLDERQIPDIFYSPDLGGHWVMRRYDHVFEVFRDQERFTNYPVVIPAIQAHTEPMIPFHIDPPYHQRYRRLLGPLFTPMATKRMEEIVRAIAIELIEPIADSGETDFVHTIAHKFPPLVFLRSMGMPTDRMPEFVKWASDSLVGSAEEQMAAGANITAFISDFVDHKYDAPGDDWTSLLIAAREPDGSALSRDEIVKIGFFLFLAGLDTVLNSLSHAWRYLGEHPDAQAKLRADPSAIPSAIEEMLRVNVIFNNSRRARHDLDFHGITMKQGDPILMLVTVANREESRFENGAKIDLERELSPHMTFGAGIHRCIGSNLARAELRIAMEEWLKHIPTFCIRDGADIRSIGGVSMGLRSLPLVWDRPDATPAATI